MPEAKTPEDKLVKKPAAKKETPKKAAHKAEAKAPTKKASAKPVAKKPVAKKSSIKDSPAGKTVTVRLVKSPIGTFEKQRGTVRGLGLRKVGSERTLEDTPAVRGMVRKIQHMVQVVG